MHWSALALFLARDSARNNRPARIAMMATTTSNSMSVNPLCRQLREGTPRFCKYPVLIASVLLAIHAIELRRAGDGIGSGGRSPGCGHCPADVRPCAGREA